MPSASPRSVSRKQPPSVGAAGSRLPDRAGEVDPVRRLLLTGGAAAALQLAGCDAGIPADGQAEDGMSRTSIRLPVEGQVPSLAGATGWLNSEPLTEAGLRGKVVLFDFCTYTCINWIRTLPYIRGWADKYREHGFVLVGVHTPEFAFERDVDRVQRALEAFGVDYPVALDADYGVWEAFHNQYWPALYIADAEGRIRHHFFGEGGTDRTELVIQQLLVAAGRQGVPDGLVAAKAAGVEVAADWNNLKSPETYLGYRRSQNFRSPGGGRHDQLSDYTLPQRLGLNTWALKGAWAIGPAAAELGQAGGGIAFAFHARDLHLVMGPASPARPVRFRVRLDGQPPGAHRGVDIDEAGNGVAAEQRMYHLVRQSSKVVERSFEIEFLDAGVAGFAFTFG